MKASDLRQEAGIGFDNIHISEFSGKKVTITDAWEQDGPHGKFYIAEMKVGKKSYEVPVGTAFNELLEYAINKEKFPIDGIIKEGVSKANNKKYYYID